MCGIFGFVGNGKAKKDILLSIAEKACERGPDGFGIVFWEEKEPVVFYGKSSVFDSAKTAEKEIRKIEKANLILGHFRMSTQGGLGINHPFRVNDTWLVHNGNVYEKERYKHNTKTDCDSELVAFEVSEKWANPNGNQTKDSLLKIAKEMHDDVHFAIGVTTGNALSIVRSGHPIFVKKDETGYYFCSKSFEGSELIEDGIAFVKSENEWKEA